MNRTLFAAVAALGIALSAAPAAAQIAAATAHPGASEAAEPDLDAVRRATEKYRDVQVALADGYIPDPSGMCITSAMEGQPKQLGGMGIHYFRPDLLGITGTQPRVAGNGTHTDFLQPSVLVYEPQADGSLELVAVENLIFQAGWNAAGHTAPPSYLGNEYYSMVDNPVTEPDEAHGFEPHYELHVWLYRDNPNGMFAPFNPATSCEHSQSHAGHHGQP